MNFKQQLSKQDKKQMMKKQFRISQNHNKLFDKGLASFQATKIDLIQNLMNQDTQQILSQQEWIIKGQREKWISLFGFMEKASCTLIELKDQEHTTIPKQLILVRFPNLISLSLRQCQIRSLQSLGFMDCPNLHTLDLKYNAITNIKSLDKTKWQKLQSFKLNSNYLTSFNLSRFKTQKQSVKMDLSQIIDNELLNVVKIELQKIKRILGIMNRRNFMIQKLRGCLKKRYPKSLISIIQKRMIPGTLRPNPNLNLYEDLDL